MSWVLAIRKRLIIAVDSQLWASLAYYAKTNKYLGNNHIFNETLFDQLVYADKQVGESFVTVEAAALDRVNRINDSIARDPQFFFETPRFLGTIAESGFALAMFVSNQTADPTFPLTLDHARSFFDTHKYLNGFYRRQGPYEFPHVKSLTYKLVNMVGRRPGRNEGTNNYVVNPEDFATKQVNLTAKLYPNPTPRSSKTWSRTTGHWEARHASNITRTGNEKDQIGATLWDSVISALD